MNILLGMTASLNTAEVANKVSDLPNQANNISAGYNLAFIGVTYVFSALLFLCLVIYLMKYLEGDYDEDETNGVKPKNSINKVESSSDEDETVAVITAAIHHHLKGQRFVIKSIKPFSKSMNNWKMKEIE